MWSIPSLLPLPDPFWLEVVALDKVLSMGQIELNCVLMLNCSKYELFLNAKLDCLKQSFFEIEIVYLC